MPRVGDVDKAGDTIDRDRHREDIVRLKEAAVFEVDASAAGERRNSAVHSDTENAACMLVSEEERVVEVVVRDLDGCFKRRRSQRAAPSGEREEHARGRKAAHGSIGVI